MTRIVGHVATKILALRALVRGRRGEARILWRWMANQPTPADLVKARDVSARPHVKAELERLRRGAEAAPLPPTEATPGGQP